MTNPTTSPNIIISGIGNILLTDEGVPERIPRKNALHQLDFPEALTYCRHGMDRMPETVIPGVAPQSILAYCDEMTPLVRSKLNDMIQLVLDEVSRLGGNYRPKGEPH